MAGGEGRRWHEVRRRISDGYNGPINGRNRTGNNRETTFFVSNLGRWRIVTCSFPPIDWRPAFGHIGRWRIRMWLQREHKAGDLFGFVRFYDAENKWEMECSMGMVVLNNAKLSVNLAKFDKDGKPNGRPKVSNPHQNYVGTHQHVQDNIGEDRGRTSMSYKEVLTWNPDLASEVTVLEDADFDTVQWYD
ncbi:hypothetical protein L1987_80092 [Smallanthus sonchifolius]|uniref:Uncharacterized protein n=1 Tax=Smallanthus sonchifolius TaxID=185202 RepID=A0ACB8YMC9_9ASTR|nr:hypothetical protein L1987_80092 [Smallanthus sonchifolius]